MKQDILNSLDEILEQRKQASPDDSYTAKLFNDGIDSILKKVGEEATETVIASKSGKSADIIHEIADLWFHTLVLLKYHGLDSNDVLQELEGRFGLSGLEEKANRKK
ncbi:MAG: phosphoribosyl-ATP diphosphatase [Proteobacteria bacterium]|nr:phosphoribosyl-ATP diphosphatase [Pseudomonadota bacterium]NOG60721.1 phosphoribosyl-ATP diphosphatase [Pseudomonadota bacterium]